MKNDIAIELELLEENQADLLDELRYIDKQLSIEELAERIKHTKFFIKCLRQEVKKDTILLKRAQNVKKIRELRLSLKNQTRGRKI